MEIAEDAEEDNRAKRQSTVPEERPTTAKAPSITGTQTSTSSPQHVLPTGLAPSTSYRSMATESESWQPPPREPRGSEIRSRSPAKSIDERRKSLQSTRPDLYSYASYGSNGKPKIKLGPRPSLDVGGRPHTSGAFSHYRPVSTLPAGLKLFSRGSKKGRERPTSQYPSDTPSMTISPPPVPDTITQAPQNTLARPHTSGGRPTTSTGTSMKPLMSPTTTAPKTPSITPEKARLMKALELRKKQMSTPASTAPISPNTSGGLKSPTVPNNRSSSGAPKEVHDTLEMLNDMSKGDDSGIAFDASSTLKTDESDATRSDSYPVSPVGPSERAASTRASSISESTDETIQEPNGSKRAPESEEQAPEEEKEDPTLRNEPHQIPTPPPDEKVELNADKPATEQLPQLLPVAYQPPINSWVVPETTPPAIGTVSQATEDSSPPETPNMIVEDELNSHPVEEIKTTPSEPILEIDQPVPDESTRIVARSPKTTPLSDIPVKPTSPVKVEIKEWKVPRSKFSVQDLKATEIPSIPDDPLPRPSSANLTAAPKSPVGSTFSADTKRSLTEDDQEHGQPSSKRKKRRGLVEPIRTDIEMIDKSAANSEANFSSDDDLMDELQSAVFQEAKPISVSKSPISPVFPSPKKRASPGNRFSRAFSNPLRKDSSDPQLLTLPSTPQPEPSRSVSASAAYLNNINQQQAKPMAKKVNLGSGISQRIKALEKLSSSAPGASVAPTGPSSGASPAFFSVRKGNVRAASRSPSIAERANSLNRNSPSPSLSRESSPETFKIRERSSSIQSRVDAFKSSPVPTSQPQRSRPESISVTARIVRDPAQPFPQRSEAGKDPSEYAPLDLKQSPLVIDHQKAVVTPPKETIQERRLSNPPKTTKQERRSSITIVKDLINEGRASFAERRRSITLEPSVSSPSIRSPSRPPSTHASPAHKRPMSISSRLSTSSRDLASAVSPPPTAGSSSSTSEEKADKKSNRASRMLRRMSSSLSSGRKTLAHAMSPTVREESEPANGVEARSLTSSHPSHASMTPTATSFNIGDVNVQFPDTLLWKRRSMLLDSQGYLILSPALTAHEHGKDKSNAGATRRFHLSEFRTPAIPDVEMQELPNSVVLDFLEGGGLQIACEDRAGQGHVLSGKYLHSLIIPILIKPSPARCTPNLGSLRPMTPLRTYLFVSQAN